MLSCRLATVFTYYFGHRRDQNLGDSINVYDGHNRPHLKVLSPKYLETEPMSTKFENSLRPTAFSRLPHVIRRGFFS